MGVADANVADVVQEAGIFTGLANASRPSLESAPGPQPPPSATTLETGIGAFHSAGATSGSDRLGGSATGASQTADELTRISEAIQAYSATRDL